MATKVPSRPWREIAAEICKEQDAKLILQLCEELTRALDAQKPGTPETGKS